MPIRKNILRKGKAPKQNLRSFDVFREETGVLGDLTTSQYFNISEFPSVLPTGNSSFLIEGSNLLKPNVELKTELLDAQGNPIFHYAIPYYNNELPARRIAIEIYTDDVVNGVGSFTVLGELDPRTTNVPTQFQDTYNVRFTAPITINKRIKNTEPIRFYGDPTITVSELVKGVIATETSTGQINETITGSVQVDVTETITETTVPNNPFVGNSDNFDSIGNNKKKYFSKNFLETQPQIIEEPSIITTKDTRFTYVVKEMEQGTENSLNKITSAMGGATITFNNPHQLVDSTLYPDSKWTKPTTFETTIIEVINSTSFKTSENYFITSKTNNNKVYVGLKASSNNVSITHKVQSVGEVENTVFKRSYANITVGNLQTFSGDTYKAKIYMKEDGTAGSFEPIYETLVASPNELIDVNSISGFKSVGVFNSQSIVDNYWVTSSNLSSATQNDDTIINGVLLSGSNAEYGSSYDFKINDIYSLQKNETYVVSFGVAFKPTDKTQSNGTSKREAKLEVFLTGSFVSTQDQELKLGEVDLTNYDFETINDYTPVKQLQIIDFQTHNESSLPSGSLGFRVHSGEFILNDIRLKPYSEQNFSPGFFKANVPMPKPIKRGQNYDFYVEFFDANNNKAEAVAIADNISFQGPPQVIADGLDATFSGSMVIGESMEMYGVNPAYLRSIGYQGFQHAIDNDLGGFLIFSGSINSRISASESGSSFIYDGVGLEVVDGGGDVDRYLRFRTKPSIFEVATDTFFLGREGQFISGSNGNIAISSSNFFLGDSNGAFISGSNSNLEISSDNFSVDVNGNVTMSGYVSASGGYIGNFEINDGKISGSNITMDANTSQIYKTDQGPGSDTGAAFDQLRDEYYIDFTPSGSGDPAGTEYYIKMGPNFMVDKDGILIASGATFIGTITASAGLIGGFTIGSASLFSGTDEVTTPFFFSGSATGNDFDKGNLFISASGFQVNSQGAISASSGQIGGFNINTDGLNSDSNEFQITGSTGQITGSNVLFDGGKIGGFELGESIISSSNGDLVLKSNGQITASNAELSGNLNAVHIKATSGSIGGWVLDTTELSGTNAVLKSSGVLSLGSGTDNYNQANRIYIDGANTRMSMGTGFRYASNALTIDGSATIGGWTINSSTITGGNVTLNSAGEIKVGTVTDATTTATTNSGFFADNSGNVLIKGNTSGNDYLKISGGGSIDIKAQSFDLDATTIILDSGTNNGKIALGASPPSAYDNGTGFYVDGTGAVLIGAHNGNRIQFGGSTVTIQTDTFELDTTNLDISSTAKRITVNDGTQPRVYLGEVDGGSTYGMKIFDGTGTADGDILVELGEGGNNIAGWTISSDRLTGGNLILRQDGVIETSNFVSGEKGFRLSAINNGTLEVEEATIRGTLKTTVFEKETVNAVGGQLVVANSTVITGSDVGKTDTTMSVVNVTGFEEDEILFIKKVSGSGFSKEFVQVGGSKRFFPSSNTDFSGELHVTRAYGTSATFNPDLHSGSLSDTAGTGSSYTPGQVVVSTGKLNTGYIKLNANPNDPQTPFIDIVERTGSGVYDVDLKARLGDLSGLSSALVGTNPGFGLFSENVFLTGKITATSGQIAGLNITSESIYVGTGTYGNANTEFFVSSSGDFSLGSGLVWDASEGTLSIGDIPTSTDISASISASVDPYRTQIVLSSTGMDLKDQSTNVLASYGQSAKIFPRGITDTYTEVLANSIIMVSGSMTGSAITAHTSSMFGSEDKSERVEIVGTGLKVYESNHQVASFGNTIRVGRADESHQTISATTTQFLDGDGSTVRLQIANDGIIDLRDSSGNVKVQADTTGVKVLADNTTTFGLFNASGITLVDNNVTGSLITATTSSMFGASSNDRVEVTSTGMKVYESNKQMVNVGSNGLDVYDTSNNLVSSFGSNVHLNTGTVYVGVTGSSGDWIEIDSTSIDINRNNSNKLKIKDTAVQIYGDSTTSFGLFNSSGLTFVDNNVTASTFTSTAATLYGASTNDRVVVDADGLEIYTANVKKAEAKDTGFTAYGDNTTTYTQVNASGITLVDNSNTKATFAAAGATIYGDNSTTYTQVNASGLTIVDNSVTQGTFAGGVVTLYGGSSADYARINSSGLQVYESSTEVASFGSTVRVGVDSASESALRIDGSGNLTIGTSGTSNISMTNTGVVTIAGGLNATHINTTSGSIAGWTIDTNTIEKLSGDAGITLDASNNRIIISGSNVAAGGTSGNSVRLFGNSGVIEVSQSGQGVFDTGRTKTFTTEYIVKTDSSRDAINFVKEVDSETELPHTITRTTTSQAAPKLLNVEVENSVDAGIVKTDKLFVTSPTGDKGTNIYMNAERNITTLAYNGATNPTASYYFGNNVDYSFNEESNANLHPGFHYHYHVSNSVFVGAEQPIGFVQGGAASGSSIFTISTAMVSEEDDDFADAKFNILALDANTSGLGAARQNEYTFLQARHSGSIRVQIQHDGDIVSKGNITGFASSFLTVSDEREKKDIYQISESLDRILELRPTKFTWIETNKEDVGFIAQEVEKVIPEVVETTRGFINTGDDKERKTISYPKLIPYLVDTIKTLTQRIEELEKKVK